MQTLMLVVSSMRGVRVVVVGREGGGSTVVGVVVGVADGRHRVDWHL
jgi:hypothetical protein